MYAPSRSLRSILTGRLWALGAIVLLGLSILLERVPLRISVHSTIVPAVPSVKPDFGKLPLSFVTNLGQSDPSVRFQVHTMSGTLFFTPDEVVVSLVSPPQATGMPTRASNLRTLLQHSDPLVSRGASTSTNVVRVRFDGANPRSRIAGVDLQFGTVNYLIGNDPAMWHTNVPTYGGVIYKGLYPGIDLRYDGMESRLKGTYIVAPHATPSSIRWRYDGLSDLELDAAAGTLHLATISQQLPHALSRDMRTKLIEEAPVAWQQIDGRRILVDVRYHLFQDHSVGFDLGAYDARYPLTIDPTLVFSTYLGGSDDDVVSGVAVDVAGNVYVAGVTFSSDFPTQAALQGGRAGTTCEIELNPAPCTDAFVVKLAPDGRSIMYSTYVGGSQPEWTAGVDVDAAGNVVVTGDTRSPDFPMVNAVRPVLEGYCARPEFPACDVFTLKLNALGNGLIYSTYLGGHTYDAGKGVVVDAAGNAYVAADTVSPDIPFQAPNRPGCASDTDQTVCFSVDTLVVKLEPDGRLVYATTFGGTRDEETTAIATDPTGAVYVVGGTHSPNFPTSRPLQPATHGEGDIFVTKLAPDGATFAYSTYLGGTGLDLPLAVAVDAMGHAYLTGFTESTDFPTASPLQANARGGACGRRACLDAFVTKLLPDGSGAVFSTYLGGTANDRGEGIAVDQPGNVYIAGSTGSPDLPLVNPIQAALRGGHVDLWIARLAPSGSELRFSTYLGGGGDEYPSGLDLDQQGNLYVAGSTDSRDFPLLQPIQSAKHGNMDMFVLKIARDEASSDDERCFPETGQCLAGRFRAYWEQNGGLPVFGYPITAAANETNRDTNQPYLTQWFERNRFEFHPENASPYDVLLGRLGDDALRTQGRDWQTEPHASGPQQNCLWFEQTGHNVCDQATGLGFKTYWQTHGLEFDGKLGTSYDESLALFGLPLTEPKLEQNSSGDVVQTQWFERARFEWHPDKPDEFKVLLGLLGNEIRVQR